MKKTVAPLFLIPTPKKLRLRSGICRFSTNATLDAPETIDQPLATALMCVVAEISAAAADDAEKNEGEIHVEDTGAKDESYRLEITPKRVTISGGAAGLFNAVQTLRQIVRQRGAMLPCLQIDDAPDFATRGFYHDISRGKVPTLETLFALVERMATLKLNQLQLYIEHTFAFQKHADIWAGSDPLTAEDIRKLDAHCARYRVELVPSLSTFGHFYTALVSPRKQHLNEFPLDGSRLPFSWWDRMGRYTLDCQNPESLALVTEMIRELRPLFRSEKFNICCDETFDLGRGRNKAVAAALGAGRLYVDFLKKIMAAVRAAGARPMFWGDIIGNHPELVRELPKDAIALDWDYSADLRHTKAALFQRASVPFYVCPGVQGWDRWSHDINTATENIVRLACHGLRHKAAGLLNTDWGDRGHINALGNSFHGLALGAAAAWNARSVSQKNFDEAFDVLEWDIQGGKISALLREASPFALVPWKQLVLWLDPTPHRPQSWWDVESGLPTAILAISPRDAFSAYKKTEAIREKLLRLLSRAEAVDSLAAEELLVGLRGQALMQALGGHLVCLARKKRAPRSVPSAQETADAIRRFEAEVSNLWHQRNRPSEYHRVRSALLEFARRLDRAALGLLPLRTTRAEVS